MPSPFELRVESLFFIHGQGAVMTGTVAHGRVCLGNQVSVCSPTAQLNAVVTGLEELGTRRLLTTAAQGDRIGIACSDLDLPCLADGVRKNPEGFYQVVNLVVRGKSLPWWRFWA